MAGKPKARELYSHFQRLGVSSQRAFIQMLLDDIEVYAEANGDGVESAKVVRLNTAEDLWEAVAMLPDDEQERIGAVYADLCAPWLQEMVAWTAKNEGREILNSMIAEKLSELRVSIKKQLDSTRGSKAMSERNREILRLSAAGLKPKEILQELRRRSLWLTNANGKPLRAVAIRSLIKRKKRKARNGN